MGCGGSKPADTPGEAPAAAGNPPKAQTQDGSAGGDESASAEGDGQASTCAAVARRSGGGGIRWDDEAVAAQLRSANVVGALQASRARHPDRMRVQRVLERGAPSLSSM